LTSRWRTAINLILDRIDDRISKLEAYREQMRAEALVEIERLG
jgi:hypothetical protein